MALADLNSGAACTKQITWCKNWLIIPSASPNLAMSPDVFHSVEPIVQKENRTTPVGVQRGHRLVRRLQLRVTQKYFSAEI